MDDSVHTTGLTAERGRTARSMRGRITRSERIQQRARLALPIVPPRSWLLAVVDPLAFELLTPGVTAFAGTI